jgi:hypothetical protein
VAKIQKLIILFGWALLAFFLVPIMIPLVATGDAATTTIMTVVLIGFTILFPIAVIYKKMDD